MQTKKNSLKESIINTLVGFITTLLVSPLIYWVVGVKMTYSEMSVTTVMFTVISIIRNYVIRRWFNKKER